MEITSLIKNIPIYNNGEHDFIKVSDCWDIALLGANSFKETIDKVCVDKEEFNSYFDKESLKLGKGKILKETLIENFNKIGLNFKEGI